MCSRFWEISEKPTAVHVNAKTCPPRLAQQQIGIFKRRSKDVLAQLLRLAPQTQSSQSATAKYDPPLVIVNTAMGVASVLSGTGRSTLHNIALFGSTLAPAVTAATSLGSACEHVSVESRGEISERRHLNPCTRKETEETRTMLPWQLQGVNS